MVKWEYKKLEIPGNCLTSGVLQRLNRDGEDGWEVVETFRFDNGDIDWILMKRPVEVARNVFEVGGNLKLLDDQLAHVREPVVDVNHFDTATSVMNNRCGICNVDGNHDGVPHGEATGDMLTREDIVGYLNGRGLLHWNRR